MNTPNQETVNLEIDFSHRLSYPLNSLHEDELLETLGHMLERVQNVTELMTYYIEVPTEVLTSAARVANLEIRDCRSVLDAIDEARMQSKTPPKVFTNDEIEELMNPTLTKKQMDEFEAISSSDYIKQARQQVLTACTLNITEFRGCTTKTLQVLKTNMTQRSG